MKNSFKQNRNKVIDKSRARKEDKKRASSFNFRAKIFMKKNYNSSPPKAVE